MRHISKFMLGWVLVLVPLFSGVLRAEQAPSAAAKPEEPVGVILEAEDFKPDKGATWKVMHYGENYIVDAIGNGYISGMKLLSAPEKGPVTSARIQAQIPRAGKYKLWVHYEAPYEYNTYFGVTVRQNNRQVLDTVMGGADQLRLWPLKIGYKKQINPAYGGGDNVTWQGADLELKAGPAEVLLTSVENPEPAAKRNIDVVYLTSDTSDEPKNPMDPFLNDFCVPGRLWVRIHNTGKEPLKVGVGTRWNRRDWRAPDSLMAKTGFEKLQQPIAPGASSEWVDLGSIMDTVFGTTLSFSPQPRKGFTGAEIELAKQPDAKEVWRHKWTAEEAPLTVWVPVDLDLKGIFTADEIRLQIEKAVAKHSAGPTPKLIKFVSQFGPSSDDDRSLPRWLDLYYKFGYALPQMGIRRDNEEHWDWKFNGRNDLKYICFAYQNPGKKLEEIRNEYSKPEYTRLANRIEALSIGDEIGVRHFGSGNDEGFRAYCKAKGLTLKQLGVSDWSEVKTVGWKQAAAHPVMYVEGKNYHESCSVAGMKAMTSTLRETLGRPEVPVGANYAPHPIYLFEEEQWIDTFREGALTFPWSEDYAWQVPVISSQIIGWALDTMRCGARGHDWPMIYYCMPHSPGNNAVDFRLSNYLALGRGVKYINHFIHGPQMYSTENYVDFHDLNRYQETWDIIREAGRVDELLYNGKPPKAETAVMLCRYTDLWETSRGDDAYNIGGDNPNSHVYGIERQCLWLALKHAQVPVDLLTDSDVAAGQLAGVKTLYLSGSHVSRAAAKKIAAWVQGGGCLMASAAGGLWDEYNQPMDILANVYGIESQHEFKQTDRCVRPKMELPRVKPIDTVKVQASGSLSPFNMEALAIIDRVQVSKKADKAQVIGKFADGSPAVVRNQYGKGTAYLIGTMPGLAYAKAALPLLPFDRNEFVHFLPVNYSKPIRSLLAQPLEQTKVVKRVECSEPLVEGDLLESSKGKVISLTNFTGKPIKQLTVKVRPAEKATKIWSVRQGDVKSKQVGDAIEVTMPIDITDFLVIE